MKDFTDYRLRSLYQGDSIIQGILFVKMIEKFCSISYNKNIEEKGNKVDEIWYVWGGLIQL